MRLGHSLLELEVLKMRNSKTPKEQYPNVKRYVGIPRNITNVYHAESLSPIDRGNGIVASSYLAGLTPMNDDYWVC